MNFCPESSNRWTIYDDDDLEQKGEQAWLRNRPSPPPVLSDGNRRPFQPSTSAGSKNSTDFVNSSPYFNPGIADERSVFDVRPEPNLKSFYPTVTRQTFRLQNETQKADYQNAVAGIFDLRAYKREKENRGDESMGLLEEELDKLDRKRQKLDFSTPVGVRNAGFGPSSQVTDPSISSPSKLKPRRRVKLGGLPSIRKPTHYPIDTVGSVDRDGVIELKDFNLDWKYSRKSPQRSLLPLERFKFTGNQFAKQGSPPKSFSPRKSESNYHFSDYQQVKPEIKPVTYEVDTNSFNPCSMRENQEHGESEKKIIDLAVEGLDLDEDLTEEEEVIKAAERPGVIKESTDKVKQMTHQKCDNLSGEESFLWDEGDDKFLDNLVFDEFLDDAKPKIDTEVSNYLDDARAYDISHLIDIKPVTRIEVERADQFIPKELVQINRIPTAYRSVFSGYQHFNLAQSKVFEDAFSASKTMVISAPTGSGKTAIFELALIRMLHLADMVQQNQKFKAIYIAPLKTLCHERYLDWSKKFKAHGFNCVEITGDSDEINFRLLESSSLIFATPEKWNAMVRYRNFDKAVKLIKLILIDEIHLLTDKSRGPKLETIITRFKALQRQDNELEYRFIAVSATAPNTEDIAQWLGDESLGAVCYNLDDRYRAVKLTKKVIGYPCPDSTNDFMFLQKLNYKLPSLIKEYSKGRPTLVFTCTRRDCQTTAEYLSKESSFCYRPEAKNALFVLSKSVSDSKLRATLLKGIGFHHAGLSPDDRHKLEIAFLNGGIPVLIATSTLAMGVNFPAHLVIIKGTAHYVNGTFVEYGESEILQMMGRAGRPQFDDHGCAILMTKAKTESKYHRIISGEKVIESNIHQSLAEIFMTEIERQTITNLSQAVEWVQSTFFYVRVHKAKQHYGLDPNWTNERVEQKIRDICVKDLNGLKKYGLIEINHETGAVKATEIGRMMAMKSISYHTMCTFLELKGSETLKDLLIVLTKCHDINQDVNIRNTEKKHLNQFNMRSKTEGNRVIRFPFNGRIKSKEMKINVLIQATLGCIPFPKDSNLIQETGNLMKIGQRLSRCLVDVALIKATNLKFLLNCIILAKCLRAGIWENSKFISKQIARIGLELSSRMVEADLTTFQKIETADPRTIEMFCRRNITFGEYVIKEARKIPKYSIDVERCQKSLGFPETIKLRINLVNWETVSNDSGRFENHTCVLLIGDQEDRILEKQRINDKRLLKENGIFEKIIAVPSSSSSLFIHYIDEYHCGTDVSLEYFPRYAFTTSQNDVIRRIPSINSSDALFKPKVKKKPKGTQPLVDISEEMSIPDSLDDEELIG